MVNRRGSRIWKFMVVFFLLMVLIAGLLVLYMIFIKPSLEERFSDKISDLEKQQKKLEEEQKRLEEEMGVVDDEERDGKVFPWWILVIVIVGVSGFVVYFFFFKFVKKASGLKTKDEMVVLGLDYLRKEKGWVYNKDDTSEGDIKSYHIKMFRPFPEDATSIFVLTVVFDSFRKGVLIPSHRCYSVVGSNRDPDLVWEDYPCYNLFDVMKELFERHFVRHDKGLPFLKTKREELIEGLTDVKLKAAREQLESFARGE